MQGNLPSSRIHNTSWEQSCSECMGSWKWDTPLSFWPQRFTGSTIDFKGPNFEFIPFGAGRRMCSCLAFGLASVELALAQLLFCFDWKLPTGMKPEDLDMTENFGLTAPRKSELVVLLG